MEFNVLYVERYIVDVLVDNFIYYAWFAVNLLKNVFANYRPNTFQPSQYAPANAGSFVDMRF